MEKLYSFGKKTVKQKQFEQIVGKYSDTTNKLKSEVKVFDKNKQQEAKKTKFTDKIKAEQKKAQGQRKARS